MMPQFVMGTDGKSTNGSQVTLATVPVDGEEFIGVNHTNSTVVVNLGTFNADLTATITYPNHDHDSDLNDVVVGSGDSFKIGAESFVFINVANASTTTPRGFTVAANGVCTTHGTSAQTGEIVYLTVAN